MFDPPVGGDADQTSACGTRFGRWPFIAALMMVAAWTLGTGSPAAADPQTCGATTGPSTRIGNRVFADLNDDGVFDIGDAGLDGMTVELWADVDADGAFEPNGDDGPAPRCSVVTSGGGSYWLHDIDPGWYFVAVLSVPTGYVSSTGANVTAGVDHVDDGAPAGAYAAVSPPIDLAIVLPTGEIGRDGMIDEETAADLAVGSATSDDHSDLTIDFGFVPLPFLPSASLGDQAWIDTNRDGRQDPAEPPAVGVTLHLFDADDRQLATVVTDESGHYSFVGLVGGTYSVCYQPSTLPGGLVSTIAGADPERDSDVVDTACTAPVALATAGTLTNLDLGLAAATVDLSVTLSGAWSAASGEIEWSIVVRNGGIDAEPGPVVVNDILPTGLGVPTITAPDGMACTFDADTRALVCTTSSPLAANASFTLGVVTPRTNLEVCEISNTLSVRGTAIDATTANNVATATVPLPCATAAPTTPAPTTPSLPSTGGALGLVMIASIVTLSGYHLVRASDRALYR